MDKNKNTQDIDVDTVNDATNAIDKIFKKTIDMIENSKIQVYNIYETVCAEVENKRQELEETKAIIKKTIDLVDAKEHDIKEKKKELATVTEKYSGFDEEVAYHKVANSIKELNQLRAKESALREKRDNLQRQLARIIESKEHTESIMTNMGAMSSFLMTQTDTVERIKDEKISVEVGQAIIEAHEYERFRISQNLNNYVVNDLNDAIWKLGIIEQQMFTQEYDNIKMEIPVLKDMLTNCNANVRDSVFDMRPVELDKGVDVAIQKYCDKLKENNTLIANYEVMGKPFSLSKYIETTMYRIVQESLSNIAAHSGQDKANISLRYEKDACHLIIQDKGKGFNVAKVIEDEVNGINSEDLQKHYGVISIKEQAKIIGGRVSFQSAPNQGAKVHLVIPKEEY